MVSQHCFPYVSWFIIISPMKTSPSPGTDGSPSTQALAMLNDASLAAALEGLLVELMQVGDNEGL
jgi:hypothetical protein